MRKMIPAPQGRPAAARPMPPALRGAGPRRRARDTSLATVARGAHPAIHRLFALSATGMMLVRLRDGAILDANAALLTLLGHDRASLRQAGCLAIAPGTWLDEGTFQRVMMQSTGCLGPLERELVASDGRRVDVLLTGACVDDPVDGPVVWLTIQDLGRRRTRERELVSAALTDPLTGLANRQVLRERLESWVAAVRSDPARRFAVLFMDFDRFKAVNDTLGHQAGDQMLREIGERLRRNLRAGDLDVASDTGGLIARLGGDEFVLVARVDGVRGAQSLARRLLEALAPPFELAGRSVVAAASIGIVIADQHCEGVEALMRDADQAMFEAKRAGGACSAVFDGPMRRRGERRQAMREALREALSVPGQLSLAYQPVIDLESRRVVSVEALARWRHPRFGEVPPLDFIPIAEEAGLMLELGDWVLREAGSQLQAWRQRLGDDAPARVAVNLSRVQLDAAASLRARIDEVLAATGLPSRCLQLEISERELARHVGDLGGTLESLRAAGVGLVLDDFGTGATALGSLRGMPYDVVKLDRSLLASLDCDPQARGMVQATLSMFHSLARDCVAEGVESATQAHTLRALGCRFAQGYHLGRPMAAAAAGGALLPA
jgi:diguanylate cyclase (GGDEF)-like protein